MLGTLGGCTLLDTDLRRTALAISRWRLELAARTGRQSQAEACPWPVRHGRSQVLGTKAELEVGHPHHFSEIPKSIGPEYFVKLLWLPMYFSFSRATRQFSKIFLKNLY